MLPIPHLESSVLRAVQKVLPDADPSLLQVRPCPDPKFGDYQCTGLMALAKLRKGNPRELAQQVAEHLELGPAFAKTEIAGPGFLNFRIKPAGQLEVLRGALRGEHLFAGKVSVPQTLVLDFSGPNVAKPMHVGHIRSTILGASLARVLRFVGHHVITDNHIGDWGTQFGKLLVGWKTRLNPDRLTSDPIGEMERLYREINTASEADPAILEQAREELVKLQAGDPENLQLWKQMIALSQHQFDTIYGRLGVTFDHTLGESFYNPWLKGVVEELKASGLATDSEGATVVFFEDLPALKAHPAIVQKSDGAANYTTTDLATLRYRLDHWHPGIIVYVTDARQQLHFQQLFAIFRRWKKEAAVQLEHVWFGSILGEDGKPFKTRSGETVKLSDLLDEAEERAYAVVAAKNPDLDEKTKREIGRIVGLGSVKYADLSQNRQSDYVFSWEKMLALNGNTAPYLQYAYTRIRSIFRKAEAGMVSEFPEEWTPDQEHEQKLIRHLLNFGFVLGMVSTEYRCNYLCSYLYELAGYFAGFYENCPVLGAAEPIRAGRLALCEVTGRVLKTGLELLGIEVVEQM